MFSLEWAGRCQAGLSAAVPWYRADIVRGPNRVALWAASSRLTILSVRSGRDAHCLNPAELVEQEFLVGGRKIEPPAGLVDELGGPSALAGEPRDRAAQRLVIRKER